MMHNLQLLLPPHIPYKLLGPKKQRTKIYVLFDSRYSWKIRYIGKTIKTLKHRLYLHLFKANDEKNKCNCYRCNWIRSVLTEGGTVCIMLIDEYLGDGCKEEIAWIAYGREEGWKLTNSAKGGEGASGYKHTEKWKLESSIRQTGTKHKKHKKYDIHEELRKKLVERMKGNKYKLGSKHTKEWKLNMSKRLIGNKNGIGYKFTPEQNKIKSERMKIYWAKRKNNSKIIYCHP